MIKELIDEMLDSAVSYSAINEQINIAKTQGCMDVIPKLTRAKHWNKLKIKKAVHQLNEFEVDADSILIENGFAHLSSNKVQTDFQAKEIGKKNKEINELQGKISGLNKQIDALNMGIQNRDKKLSSMHNAGKEKELELSLYKDLTNYFKKVAVETGNHELLMEIQKTYFQIDDLRKEIRGDYGTKSNSKTANATAFSNV